MDLAVLVVTGFRPFAATWRHFGEVPYIGRQAVVNAQNDRKDESTEVAEER